MPANTVTLQNVLKTAVSRVTGQEIEGSLEIPSKRNYATSRTMQLADSRVRRDMNFSTRYSSAINNTTYTAPNFYTPFTTPSAFQTPTNRREIYTWVQWIYENEPLIAAGVDFYAEFPLSGYKLICNSNYVKSWFEDLLTVLNIAQLAPQIAHEFYLRGDVFIFASINCPKCKGSMVDIKGKKCEHAGATWSNITLLQPDFIEVIPGFMDQPAQYFFTPTEEMIRICKEQTPKEQYEQIPDFIRTQVQSGMPIKLHNDCIWHLKHGSTPFQPYGTSLIRRLLPIYAYKDKMRQAQWLVAERHIVPIKLIKVGDDKRPASDEDLDAVHEEFANVATDPLLTIVTHHAIDFDYIGANGKVLSLQGEYEQCENEMFNGLMLNKGVITGEGPSVQGTSVGLLATNKRLETLRNLVSYWLEERIFRPASMWNGLTLPGKRGEDKYVIPKVEWDKLDLRDNTGKIQVCADLFKNNKLSAVTMYELLDIDPDQEVMRLRYEQMANMVNSPSITSGMVGGGDGFRGPLAGAGGAAPPIPMPPPMGGGLGNGLGGGLPGMPAAASVEFPKEAYRLAFNVIEQLYNVQNEQYNSRVNNRMAFVNDKIINKTHENYLRSIPKVTGRGNIVPLLDLGDDVISLMTPGPIDGGALVYPLNVFANHELFSIREANNVANAPAPLKLFTNLEQKLYDILLQQNIPYALYAQYQAGPEMQYSLDAAFPALKLGIEADSEEYHASPDDAQRDLKRDTQLATQGWTILRFTDSELEENPQEVVRVLFEAIRKLANPTQMTTV